MHLLYLDESGHPHDPSTQFFVLAGFAVFERQTHWLESTITPIAARFRSLDPSELPVSADVVESVLSRQIDDLEPTWMRHGYRLKDLVEQFDAKPAEVKALFSNTLDPARTAELREQMLRSGLPI